MLRIIAFLVFAAFQGVHAQVDCIPDHVGTISLDLNYTLYWEPSTNCDDIEYMIYIHIEDDLQYIYNTKDTFLDVSFLPHCERFYFEVRAYSEHQLSDERHLDAYIPADADANLTISHFAVIREDETLFLIWEVEEQFAHCSRGFRIVVRDGWELPRDYYTPYNYHFLNDFVPCAQYEIGVMAIYNDVLEGPIRLASYTHPAAAYGRPVLESVSPGPTYVNITWSVDAYSINRCPFTSMMVDAYPYFSNLVFPAEDSITRPPITISVGSLLPDRLYPLDVYAVNSFGRSRHYPIAVHTTPLNVN